MSNELSRLYENGGFLLVSDLPPESEVGIATQLYQIKKFSGWKLLPTEMLHMFVYAPPSYNGTGLISNRVAQFHFVKSKEILTRKWTGSNIVASTTATNTVRPAKRRRTQISDAQAEETLVSRDYLKTLDAELAPFPLDRLEEWKTLTLFIDSTCLARVIGFNADGDALVDSQMPSTADEIFVSKGQQWGKPRDRDTDAMGAQDQEELLWFAKFDLKRSWPVNATGETLSQHAKDKSWLLEHVLSSQLSFQPTQLFGELQLSFLLFTHIHNFSALEAYKRILSLLCHCVTYFSPTTPDCLVFARHLIQDVLHSQFASLREEFFTLDLPELDSYFSTELEALRTNLRIAGKTWSQSDSPNSRSEWAVFTSQVWEPFASFVRKQFGWQLESIDDYSAKGKNMHYNLLQEDGEIEAEEDEDAPVVVDLDEAYY